MPAVDWGDALSIFCVLLDESLRAMGVESQIVSPLVHGRMQRVARAMHRLPRGLGEGDRILLVHSTASPWLDQLTPPPCPTILLYTGLTPPDLCEPHGEHLAARMRQALGELAAMVPHLQGAICTSETAAEELGEITGGRLQTSVVPLIIDETLYPVDEVDVDRPVGHPPRLLAVGRALPHKRLRDAMAVHALLQRTFDPDAVLEIVGDDQICPEHTRWLRVESETLALTPARWHGKVPFPDLIALYRSADLLLFTSAHEGFGVPLLEAMWMGVPVVAVHCPGTAETLGSTGLVARHRHAAGLAELAELALTDRDLRRRLISEGRARAGHFARATLEGRLRDIWDRWG
ncbi:glycosyltransferase family 4 protein [Candidatus Sumerlaeota bacterium]|nr:glycosyltransferase family 4 protein [Candidatus Sumerlaeota bacterium]